MSTARKNAPTVSEQHVFLDAAKNYRFDLVCALVAENPEYISCQPAGRWSALHQAADVGDAPTVQFLLGNGADASARTLDGRTPLDLAKSDIVRALLDPGDGRAPVERVKKADAQGIGGGGGGGARMYMKNPTNAAQLSRQSGSGSSWIVGGHGSENLADGAVLHADLQNAPGVARELAERMDIALSGVWLPASESDTQGRVVVITGSGGGGTPEAVVLLKALGLKMEAVDGLILLDEAVVEVKDYSQTAAGFCYQDGDFDDDDDDQVRPEIQATTAIMAAELSDHFELNFSDDVVCAPVLYGGRASDGNVVAVLSMRVWT